jgi:F0F1-type ATP synthase membrane subunit c/vacuolar-type H+-ATPase subunit K
MSVDELKKSYRIVLIIGSAMIASLFIYAALVVFMKSHYRPFEGLSPFSNIDILKYILYGLALCEFFLIGLIKKMIISGKLLSTESHQQKSQFTPHIQKQVKASIITFAICESVAVYGLILFFLSGSVIDFLGLFVLSLIYFIVFFPRYSQWEQQFKKQEQENLASE